MSRSYTVVDNFDLDLCGRIMLTHQIQPELLVDALGLEPDAAQAVIAGIMPAITLNKEQVERASLIANILTRIEIRFEHDSRAVRTVLDLPLDGLRGATITSRLSGDIEALHWLRHMIDELRPIPIKWWRIGH